MDHDIIPFGYRELMLISHFRGVLYGAEQAIPPGWDQGAMLDIVRRPKSLCLFGIAAIEQSFKCLDDNFFVLTWRRFCMSASSVRIKGYRFTFVSAKLRQAPISRAPDRRS